MLGAEGSRLQQPAVYSRVQFLSGPAVWVGVSRPHSLASPESHSHIETCLCEQINALFISIFICKAFAQDILKGTLVPMEGPIVLTIQKRRSMLVYICIIYE